MYNSKSSNFSFKLSLPHLPQTHHFDDDAGSLASQDPDTVLSAINSYPCITVCDGEADDHHATTVFATQVWNTHNPWMVIACQKSTSEAQSYQSWSSLVSRLMAICPNVMETGNSNEDCTVAKDQSWAVVRVGPLSHSGSQDNLALTQEAMSRASTFMTRPFIAQVNTSACLLSELPEETLKLCKGIVYTCANALTSNEITGAWNAQADQKSFQRLLERTKTVRIPVILARTDFLNVKANHQGQLSDGCNLLSMSFHPNDHEHLTGVMHKTAPESLLQGARALQYLKQMTQEEITRHLADLYQQALTKLDTAEIPEEESQIFHEHVKDFTADALNSKRYKSTAHGHIRVIKSAYDRWVMDNPFNDSLGDAAGLALFLDETKDHIKLHPVHVKEDLSLENSKDPENNVYLAVAEGDTLEQAFLQAISDRPSTYAALAEKCPLTLKSLVGPGTAQAWKVYTAMAEPIFQGCQEALQSLNGEAFGELTSHQVQSAEANCTQAVQNLQRGHMTTACQQAFSEHGWAW